MKKRKLPSVGLQAQKKELKAELDAAFASIVMERGLGIVDFGTYEVK